MILYFFDYNCVFLRVLSERAPNMVQELGYDNCAMFPGRQSAYNMNLGSHFGYPTQQQPQQSLAHYGQDYCQFQMPDSGLQPMANSTPGSWTASVYGGGGSGAGVGGGGAARGATTFDEWPAFMTSQALPCHQPTPTYTHRANVTDMCYAQSNSVTAGGGGVGTGGGGQLTAPLSAVSPPAGSALTPQGVGAMISRQNRSAGGPYDWMKKQASFQSPPSTGEQLN